MTTAQQARPATDASMAEVIERCRDAREGFGLSLRKFSAHLTRMGYPVDWTTLQRWEIGTNRIPADYILMLSLVTRASPTWLLTGEGPRRL